MVLQRDVCLFTAPRAPRYAHLSLLFYHLPLFIFFAFDAIVAIYFYAAI